jgi:ABC-type glycerol-3-phosphate transport system permease component
MAAHPKTSRYISRRFMLYLLLIVTSILMIVPFYWSVGTSLKLGELSPRADPYPVFTLLRQ